MYVPLIQRLIAAVTLLSLPSLADYVPPQNLAPESAVVTLDSSFRDDAWLVYGYDIDIQGNVVNPRIISSSGVEPLERGGTGEGVRDAVQSSDPGWAGCNGKGRPGDFHLDSRPATADVTGF